MSVVLRRAAGGIKQGAVAQPLAKSIRVQVKPGAMEVARPAYGSITNPGVKVLAGHGVNVIGSRKNPRAILVNHGASFRVGQILTSGPKPGLPNGLVSKITAIKDSGGKDKLVLNPVSVTDAAPVINTGGEIEPNHLARASAVLGLTVQKDLSQVCGLTGGSKLTPIVKLDNLGVEAHINAAPWGGGPKADLIVSSLTTFGFILKTTGSVHCAKQLPLAEAAVPIPVGPIVIPAYVALPISAKINVSGSVSVQDTYSWASQIGMQTHRVGAAVIPTPVFSVQHPSASLGSSGSVQIGAEAGVAIEAGLGVPDAANIHVKAGTSLDAAFEPSGCSLDWRLGTLSAKGQVGIFSIGTPDFTAFTHRIWTGCNSTASSAPNESMHPEVKSRIIPLGPTSGPAGFGLNIETPVCSAGLAIRASDESWYYHLNWGGSPRTVIEIETDVGYPLGVGEHRLEFACEDFNGSTVEWTDPGFVVAVTEPARPVVVQSTSVVAGESLVFLSGPSEGTDQCPEIPGFTVTQLYMDLYSNETDSIVEARTVSMPDGADQEELSVPASAVPGAYTGREQCSYAPLHTSRANTAAFFDFENIPVTVS